MTQMEQFLDHAAQLQRDVARLNDEILTLWLAALGLALALAIVSLKLWQTL